MSALVDYRIIAKSGSVALKIINDSLTIRTHTENMRKFFVVLIAPFLMTTSALAGGADGWSLMGGEDLPLEAIGQAAPGAPVVAIAADTLPDIASPFANTLVSCEDEICTAAVGLVGATTREVAKTAE
jgi:hypothetical protein